VEEISPRAWFDKWFDGNLATDPQGAAQTPPVVRAPNGVIKDIGEIWAKGRSSYDPANIRVPTMLIIGEWDQDTPLYMAQEVFAKMTQSPDKRFVILGEGTHAMVLEKHRMRLITEVQQFLEE
jgi:pimeloyl-ACP methyl ester carboxylesterase